MRERVLGEGQDRIHVKVLVRCLLSAGLHDGNPLPKPAPLPLVVARVEHAIG
jgi:hypothetical protein